MNFLATFYIYPLSERIFLSHYLNFSLDNPRTEEEISTIKSYLLEAYEIEQSGGVLFCSYRSLESIEEILFEFRDAFSGLDEYVAKFFTSYERENIFEFIARMWVIARFDDQGAAQQLEEELAKVRIADETFHILLQDDHPLATISEKLVSYSYLLSLLIHSEGDYIGRCFIIMPLHTPCDYLSSGYLKTLWLDYLMFGIAIREDLQDKFREPPQWIFFPSVVDNIKKTAQLLDKAFAGGVTEKLLYIGSTLKTVSSGTGDMKAALVMLTSIIELLLTHSPNTNRFNVEDSINKQFQLKASILIYLNDKSQDINGIKRRLKTIYEQRSNVAHGNFGAVDKYISKLSKKEGEEEGFEDLKSDLYRYIRAILEEYLKDRAFVDFLKEN